MEPGQVLTGNDWTSIDKYRQGMIGEPGTEYTILMMEQEKHISLGIYMFFLTLYTKLLKLTCSAKELVQ